LGTLIGFAIIIVWSYWIIDTLIRDKFNIEAKRAYPLYLNKFHAWVESLSGTFAVVTLVTTVLAGYNAIIFIFALIAIAFFFLLSIFRGFMEWKFEKETKRYILTFLFIVFHLILFIGIIFIISDNLGNLHTDNGVIKYEHGTFARSFSAIYIVGYRGTDTKITIPPRISNRPVLIIKDSAFARASNLESVEIPDSIIFINRRAFFGSINLSNIYFKSKWPPIIGNDAFTNIHPGARAIVPSGTGYWPPEGTNWYGLIITYADYDFSIKERYY